jgi:hypothetical protein
MLTVQQHWHIYLLMLFRHENLIMVNSIGNDITNSGLKISLPFLVNRQMTDLKIKFLLEIADDI